MNRKPQGRILGLLAEHGPLSIREIATLGRMPVDVAKSNARALHRAKLITTRGNDD